MLWGLQPVDQQSAYGLTVEVLRRHIHLGLLLPGERLPAERALADQLSVSRVTLREALRVMETEGYFVVRRGAAGGAFVNDLQTLRTIAAHRISRDPAAVMRVMEFREAVEPTAARHAAIRRTPTDLAALEQACEQIEAACDIANLRRAECQLYRALGTASHNELLAKSMEDAQIALFIFPPEQSLAAGQQAAAMLLASIRQRDTDRAEQAARQLIALDRARLKGVVGFA